MRTITTLTCAALLVTGLAACSDSKDDAKSSTTSTSQSTGGQSTSANESSAKPAKDKLTVAEVKAAGLEASDLPSGWTRQTASEPPMVTASPTTKHTAPTGKSGCAALDTYLKDNKGGPDAEIQSTHTFAQGKGTDGGKLGVQITQYASEDEAKQAIGMVATTAEKCASIDFASGKVSVKKIDVPETGDERAGMAISGKQAGKDATMEMRMARYGRIVVSVNEKPATGKKAEASDAALKAQGEKVEKALGRK